MKRYFTSRSRRLRYALVAGDMFIIILSSFTASMINFNFFSSKPLTVFILIQRIVPWTILSLFLYIIIFYLMDLYDLDKARIFLRSIILISASLISASLITSGILFFFTKYIIGRKVVVLNFFILLLLLAVWRLIFVFRVLRNRKPLRLALIGTADLLKSFITEYSAMDSPGGDITRIFISRIGDTQTSFIPSTASLCSSIQEILDSEDYDVLIFDDSHNALSGEEVRLILQKKFQGKTLSDFPSFYEELTGKVSLSYVDRFWLLSNSGFHGRVSPAYMHAKRFISIVLSFVLLVLASPFILLISCAVKLESKGGAFFLQERLGKQKKPFICYKFRTMYMEAEKETGPTWANKDDPRITRIGKFLRKTRLDELPQLVNILKGEMTFVGNRPIRKYFAEKLSLSIPFYDLRFSIKPGLTGWAQVNTGYSGSDSGQLEKFQYELFYIKNMSFFLDLYILFKTMKTVLQKKGE